MSEIDHLGLVVRDMDKAVPFYTEVLGTLGIKCLTDFVHDGKRHAGFGREKPVFWLSATRGAIGGVHVAFSAESRAEVIAFHTVALSLGGRDNGKPGLRPHYHPHYFGAFVLDADGNNIEAVCHGAE